MNTNGSPAPTRPVAIIGAGPIGLLLAFVVRQLGAGGIFISEPSSTRRTFAASLGYQMLDPSDPVADLSRRTAGSLADVAFDAAGVPSVAATLPRLVRPAGRIAVVAVYGRAVELDLQAIVFREQTVLGNRVYTPADIDAALALLRDDGLALRPLIGDVVPLAEAADAFARLRTGDAIKVLVEMDAG
jgi:threonine dehydrogenase-like Zn-dependent dehydrogenase